MDFDLHVADAQLLLIDIQERFTRAVPSIVDDEGTGRYLYDLAAGCRLLEVPITISEQVPDKLGATLPAVLDAAGGATVLSKQAFSCGDDSGLRDHLAAIDRPAVIVAGIEAHVCVLATVDDLLRRGYRVVVAADAVDSRRAANRDLALGAMRQLGALCLPVESVLFRLQREAGTGRFRELSKLVK